MTSTDVARRLRATRPSAPHPLRERVQAIVAGDPSPAPRSLVRPPRRRRALLVALPAAAVLAAVAAGVVGLASDDPGTPTIAAPGAVETAESPAAGTAESFQSDRASKSAGADAAAGRAAPTPTAERAQRYAATIGIEVPDTDALSRATQQAIATTRSLGGHLVTVSYGAGRGGSASLLLRVPTARVQDALARLSALGTITSQNIQIDDLQASLDEATGRAEALRKRIASLTAQLAATGLTARERARLEATRRDLRDDLAAERRSAQSIRSEAALATIQLELRTQSDETAAPPPPSRFDRAVDDALEILAVEGLVVLYALLVGLPLALAAAAVWLATRAILRRDRERLLGSG